MEKPEAPESLQEQNVFGIITELSKIVSNSELSRRKKEEFQAAVWGMDKEELIDHASDYVEWV